jgi:hypothetical protein
MKLAPVPGHVGPCPNQLGAYRCHPLPSWHRPAGSPSMSTLHHDSGTGCPALQRATRSIRRVTCLTRSPFFLIISFMAQRTIVELLDDIDGKPADETVPFGLDGKSYELDLSKKNAQALRKLLGPYVEHGRKISTRGRVAASKTRAGGVDPKAVRAWAARNRQEVPARGRIPKSVLEAYSAAGN